MGFDMENRNKDPATINQPTPVKRLLQGCSDKATPSKMPKDAQAMNQDMCTCFLSRLHIKADYARE
jgi:hypothetical protein